MMTDSSLNPFLLAANTPSPDPRLLPLLRSNPSLASQQDGHGYSLLHAAASYDHRDLLYELVRSFDVDVNLLDEDGETCLFVTETVETAALLVEELHIKTDIRNNEGQIAMEKISAEGDYPEVAGYLQDRARNDMSKSGSVANISATRSTNHPPPLPPNMNINFDTVTEEQFESSAGQEPDPEFRRRIEELAAKENFDTDEGQRELRNLITDAVRGVNNEDREVRQRVE